MKICPFCNANLPDDSEFCTNCGMKLSAEQKNAEKTSEKSLNVWKILFIVLIVLVVIGVSVGAAYYFLKADDVPDEDTKVSVDEDETDDKENSLDEDESATVSANSENNLNDSGESVDKTGIFKIGGIGPVSGYVKNYGLSVQHGAQLAVDEINANGGINGYQIEFDMKDDMHDTGVAVSSYNSLEDWGMHMLMGTVTSTPCVAVAGEAVTDNMFMLTPCASNDKCIEAGDNIFSVCYTDSQQGRMAAEYIAENSIASKIGIIYNSEDAYSSGVFAEFKNAAALYDLEIVAETSCSYDNNTDFTAQLYNCKSADAELVFIPMYYSEASIILKQADFMNYSPVFFGCDSLDGILDVKNFDVSLAEGVMFLSPFANDDSNTAIQNFVSAYKSKYNNEIPNQFAADAYDAIYAIKAAAEKADISPNMSVSEICDEMKVAMTQITMNGLTGSGMTWTANGAVSKSPKAVIIKNGIYVSAN